MDMMNKMSVKYSIYILTKYFNEEKHCKEVLK